MVGNILVFCQLFIVLYSFYINFKNSEYMKQSNWYNSKCVILSNKNLIGYYFLEITIIDELFPLKFNFVNNALFVESIVSAYR